VSKLALDDEQRMLRDTVRDLLAEHSPVAQVRRLRDDPASIGYDPKLWHRLIELGLIELLAPDAGTCFEAGIVARELGRNLVPSPFLATCAALHCCAAAGVTAPEGLVVLAHQEGGHHSDRSPSTTATPIMDGYALQGAKHHVAYGAEADALVVTAALDGVTALFLVDATAVTRRSGRLIDTRHRARIDLATAPGTLLCPPERASALLASALTHTTALLAAEMLGSAEAAFALTIAHLQQREQFGVLIGTFQALQHRAARLYVELELGTSLVLEALRLLDAGDAHATPAVSAAKAFMNDVALAVAREGAQLHGGLGMTDEADIGLYLKRARVAASELGDNAYHHRVVAGARGI
jgi:alkylation response protein AidB-like acyl-CoA dehydrogenase